MKRPIEWAYGITTVPERVGELFPRTLKSLRSSGFDKPRIFIDGAQNHDYDLRVEEEWLRVTEHCPPVRTAANWLLAAWELHLRNPTAHRYAIFQDDIVASRNLREYLERSEYPTRGYWNLCTYPVNDSLAKGREGWFLSNQYHKGAQALVFDNVTMRCLLSNLGYAVERLQDERYRYQCIDGTVGKVLKSIGCKEYVHNPSMVCHTGVGGKTSMTFAPGHKSQPVIESFRGEDFDLLTLLK